MQSTRKMFIPNKNRISNRENNRLRCCCCYYVFTTKQTIVSLIALCVCVNVCVCLFVNIIIINLNWIFLRPKMQLELCHNYFNELTVNVVNHWNQLCNTYHFPDSWLNVAEIAALIADFVNDSSVIHLMVVVVVMQHQLYYHLNSIVSVLLCWPFYLMRINDPFHWANAVGYFVVYLNDVQIRKSELIDVAGLWNDGMICGIYNGIQLPNWEKTRKD